jgi:2-C-methyl-D-erythritol 2,4-cyclodiphosphate synthase
VSGRETRVGIGYDVHRLVAGRPLVLGGVAIPAERGLLGHSDADVAIHAIVDALLGAAALGDIGQHFPPGDPAYQDIDSRRLLARARALLDRHGWRPVNVDCTIVAEAPKLAPHAAAMRAALGETLGLPPERVAVKATTNEGIGFIGRGEGIAALAVALIEAGGLSGEQQRSARGD